MKKIQEIPNYSEVEPLDLKWLKDSLVHKLEQEGHKTIAVNRAVVTIEQCEETDDFPEGWSVDPLKITVYPDSDVSGDGPQEVFIHAGRYGLMDMYLRQQYANPGNDEPRSRVLSLIAVEVGGLPGTRAKIDPNAVVAKFLTDYPLQQFIAAHSALKMLKPDGVRDQLAEDVINSFRAYAEYTQSLSES